VEEQGHGISLSFFLSFFLSHLSSFLCLPFKALIARVVAAQIESSFASTMRRRSTQDYVAKGRIEL
jgi:hypothetical protein